VSALRIGTRASALALWQANRVADLIRRQPGAPQVQIVHIHTEGDQRTDQPLWQVGGRAFFTREIDRAVLASEVDIAVHSLKDLPTALDAGLELAAVLEREDPRDALLCRSVPCLEDLPAGALVGTSSLRRRAFLARARGDLTPSELRGNVPTRVERLAQGRYDAIILAAAGLKRLGLSAHITTYLPPEQFTPAVSQGAIGVVGRTGDGRTASRLQALDHFATRVATLAERALLHRVEGGCQVPLGALGRLTGERLSLVANVCALDGSACVGASEACELGANPHAAALRAADLGERVGEQLLARGALRLIEQQRAAAGSAAAKVER
jgi:hydroxymethylbilane synthase